MLHPIRTTKFKKQFALAENRGKDMNKLIEVMGKVINEEPLPPELRNHSLHGKWKGHFECHVEPDWLLVYKISKSLKEVTFSRTGSHSDLF